jgi:hypothetical protein
VIQVLFAGCCQIKCTASLGAGRNMNTLVPSLVGLMLPAGLCCPYWFAVIMWVEGCEASRQCCIISGLAQQQDAVCRRVAAWRPCHDLHEQLYTAAPNCKKQQSKLQLQGSRSRAFKQPLVNTLP